jgi:hypothetical protein
MRHSPAFDIVGATGGGRRDSVLWNGPELII